MNPRQLLRFHRHYRVAIVGSGPAGFYTAHHLLSKAKNLDLKVDFFDRLPAPYGLSRYGVAPDHPEVKNCEEYLDNLMKNHQNVRFFGNVNIGQDVSLKQLKDHYHSIVLAFGCTSADNTLEISGNDHKSVISARSFVNWYNSHPDSVGFSPPPLDKIENVTIIGNGNVAIDVARVLLADTKHWLPTDINTDAVELLKKSSVKKVNIVARRGLLESAFTNKEIRELIELSKHLKVSFVPLEPSVLKSVAPLTKLLGRVDKRKVSLLEKALANAPGEGKQWALEFLKSPVEFKAKSEDLLESTRFEINELAKDNLTGKVSVKPTGKFTEIKNELVVLSIGYKGAPLAGFDEVGLAFDHNQNCLVHNGGRMLNAASTGNSDVAYNHGWYTSGWIKHGPKGVIATTMMESFDTAENILEDLTNGVYNEPTSGAFSAECVSWEGWGKINAHELREGERLGKTRAKVHSAEEMVSISLQ